MKKRLIICTIFSAILFPLAMPNDILPYGSPVIGLFCLVPLFFALTKSPTMKFAACLGMIFGAISTFLTYYWLMFFGDFSVWTITGVVLAYIGFYAYLGAYIQGITRKLPRYRVIMLAMIWVCFEFIKSNGFLAFPWSLMAHPFHELLPMLQIADIFGVWGVSFTAVLINALITEALWNQSVITLKKQPAWGNRKWLMEGAFTAIILILSFLYGTVRLNQPIPARTEVSVLLVQQNRDPWANGNRELSIIEGMDLSKLGVMASERKPDLIAWSETSFQYPIADYPDYFERYPPGKPFMRFVRETGTYFLVGTPALYNRERREYMNSTTLISPEGYPLDIYGKIHPVPFAESIPLWDLEIVKNFFNNIIGIYGMWVTGQRYTIFELPLKAEETLTFGTPICFEDGFPDLCRNFILKGADMWINLTNVSWSTRESAELQMFVASKFRSIENKRVLIRSTNSGVTSVIDPLGRTLKQLPLFKKDFLTLTLPVYKENSFTIYTKSGDLFPLVNIFLISLFLVLKTFFFRTKINTISRIPAEK